MNIQFTVLNDEIVVTGSATKTLITISRCSVQNLFKCINSLT